MDSDRDGRINLQQFRMAMSMINQAKQGGMQGANLHSSLPASAVGCIHVIILPAFVCFVLGYLGSNYSTHPCTEVVL